MIIKKERSLFCTSLIINLILIINNKLILNHRVSENNLNKEEMKYPMDLMYLKRLLKKYTNK